MLIVYAVVAVALAEGMWMANRQKRQAEGVTPSSTTEVPVSPSDSPSTPEDDNTTSTTPTTTVTSSSAATIPSSTATAETLPQEPSSSSEAPRPTYLPPTTQPPNNHSGYDYPPPDVPFTYPFPQPMNGWSNSNWADWMNYISPNDRAAHAQQEKWTNWPNRNSPNPHWMNRHQPYGQANPWQNRPCGNGPNTNTWKNIITPRPDGWNIPWKPTFGPYGNDTNYGQWRWNKPQGNTWGNIHSPRTQTDQWTKNILNHFKPTTNNKRGFWPNWFNL